MPPAQPKPPRPSLLEIEQILGVNWLSKVGVGILVLGISFFLAWQLRELGPMGKDVVGVIVGVTLLGTGLWAERMDRYRILARAAIAGGWSLLFFVSYAAHHVEAARVIASASGALLLMLAVGAGMVLHTLRYRSQVVTGLAFLLAFATVAMNRADALSLSANVVLAIGFSAVVLRMRWFKLEAVCIAATYINHFIWLRPGVEPMHAAAVPSAQFTTSTIILLLYWAIFRASFVTRRAPDEHASVLAGTLNTAMLLAVMQYQHASPRLAFWLLLGIGAIELALARLPRVRERRASFIMLTVMGAALAGAAFPLRFAPQNVTLIWLVDAILLSAAGIAIGERVYRRIGTIALAATALHLALFPARRIALARFDGHHAAHEWLLGLTCLAVAVALYADSLWTPRKWPTLYDHSFDHAFARSVSYAAAAVLALAGWAAFPVAGTAVVWAALSLLLALICRRVAGEDLAAQAAMLAGAAFVRVLVINLPSSAIATGQWTWRLLTVVSVAVIFYALPRTSRDRSLVGLNFCRILGPWAATTILTLLLWCELPALSVAVTWTAFAFALALIARRIDSANLTYQANALILVAISRLLVVNITPGTHALNHPMSVSWRLVTIVSIATVLYVMARWNRSGHLADWPSSWTGPTWIAAGLLMWLAALELRVEAVVPAWTILALILGWAGHRFLNLQFTAQTNAILLAAAIHLFAIDLRSGTTLIEGTPAWHLTWRAVSGVLLAGALYVLSRWNGAEHLKAPRALATTPRIIGTTLLMALFWSELQPGAVTLAWAALGLALLSARRLLRLEDLAVQANMIALAATVRVIAFDLPSSALAIESPIAFSWRLLSVPAAVVLLYALARWNSIDDLTVQSLSPRAGRIYSAGPGWIAAFVLALLAWYQFQSATVGIAWTMTALVFLEIGWRRKSRDLSLQAAVLFVAAFVRVFVVNMNIDDSALFGARVWTVAPIVFAFLYAYIRSAADDGQRLLPRWVVPAFPWMAAASAAALLRFQLSADAVVIGWSLLTLTLLAGAAWSGHRVFLHVAIALAVITLVRGVLHNLYERAYFPSPNDFDRWILLGISSAILFACLWFAFRLRRMDSAGAAAASRFGRVARWLDSRPEQILFFVPLVMLTALIGTEMRSGMLTMGWGLEGVAVFLFALSVRERTYRLSGIALLLLCIGKIFAIDFWSLTMRDKALTGIVMGLALIGVSLLYTKKRETILKYL